MGPLRSSTWLTRGHCFGHRPVGMTATAASAETSRAWDRRAKNQSRARDGQECPPGQSSAGGGGRGERCLRSPENRGFSRPRPGLGAGVRSRFLGKPREGPRAGPCMVLHVQPSSRRRGIGEGSRTISFPAGAPPGPDICGCLIRGRELLAELGWVGRPAVRDPWLVLCRCQRIP